MQCDKKFLFPIILLIIIKVEVAIWVHIARMNYPKNIARSLSHSCPFINSKFYKHCDFWDLNIGFFVFPLKTLVPLTSSEHRFSNCRKAYIYCRLSDSIIWNFYSHLLLLSSKEINTWRFNDIGLLEDTKIYLLNLLCILLLDNCYNRLVMI